jgi:hypothetical protein
MHDIERLMLAREVLTATSTSGNSNADRGSGLAIFPGNVRVFPTLLQDSPGGGCGRSSAMSRRISWNICRAMATSAIWKIT